MRLLQTAVAAVAAVTGSCCGCCRRLLRLLQAAFAAIQAAIAAAAGLQQLLRLGRGSNLIRKTTPPPLANSIAVPSFLFPSRQREFSAKRVTVPPPPTAAHSNIVQHVACAVHKLED